VLVNKEVVKNIYHGQKEAQQISNGHIYVVDALFHLFQLFNEKGNFLLHVGGQGQGEGEFWLPSGIFINDNDVIYVADSHNRRVQVFRYLGDQS